MQFFQCFLNNTASKYVNQEQFLPKFLKYIWFQYISANIFIGKTGIYRHLFRSGRICLKLAKFWERSCRKAVEGSGNSVIPCSQSKKNAPRKLLHKRIILKLSVMVGIFFTTNFLSIQLNHLQLSPIAWNYRFKFFYRISSKYNFTYFQCLLLLRNCTEHLYCKHGLPLTCITLNSYDRQIFSTNFKKI
jgi:hypothetical protein